jgi:hypothetical protein
MKPEHRVVLKIPLSELWDITGVLEHERGRILGVADVVELLRSSDLRMAVAEVGRPLTWVAGDELFEFWKNHAKPRIVPPARVTAGFRLEDFPGEHAYVATERKAESQAAVVVLECHH